MRVDTDDIIYIHEINSLPSLGRARVVLVERRGIVRAGISRSRHRSSRRVASARYFGTPQPPPVDAKTVNPSERTFQFITQRRDQMERSLQQWVELSSRTDDPLGLARAAERARRTLTDIGLRPVPDLTDEPEAYMWETTRGFDGGILLLAHLDVPATGATLRQGFRRDPEWLYGEGVGRSRGPLVMLEYALRALRSVRALRRVPLGVMLYTDEGLDAVQSQALITQATARAGQVLVCRPGTVGGGIITERRGSRRYELTVEGQRLSPGQVGRRRTVANWTFAKLVDIGKLNAPNKRMSIAALDVRTERHAMFVPHRVEASLMMSYLDAAHADEAERSTRTLLAERATWNLTGSWTARRCPNALRTCVPSRRSKGKLPPGRYRSNENPPAGAVAGLAPEDCAVGAATSDRSPQTEGHPTRPSSASAWCSARCC